MRYFVVMEDFGRSGREARVDPEITRNGVISRIGSAEYPADRIAFIHLVDTEAGTVEDVTADILREAVSEFTTHLAPCDRQAWLADRAMDERKHARAM